MAEIRDCANRKSQWLAIIASAVWLACAGCAHHDAVSGKEPTLSDAASEFAQLRRLVGPWEGVTDSGETVRVRYYEMSNGSALVEHWYFHNGVEALTIFHLDEMQLVATHYCPIGNQPTFVLAEGKPDGRLVFSFQSARNLPDRKVAHGSEFRMRILGDRTIDRHETYLADGRPSYSTVRLFRVAE